jgi:putative tricarboxylic transport membrane protein
MDLIENLTTGFGVALTPVNLLYCLIGTTIGTAIGVLPGIGPIATIAMLLPLTFSLSPVSSLIMLAGIYYGAQYGGSTTAILINLPGESSSAVTTIDGYQMARRGRAGPALAAAALGSFFAGCVSTVLIAIFALPLTRVALSFGPAEYFSLMVLGLVSSVALAHGSLLKAIAMIVLGLLLGLVGTDIYRGVPRFTLGFLEISDGIDFTAVAVGLFGLTEIMRNLEKESERSSTIAAVKGLWPTRDDLRRMLGPMVRGTAIAPSSASCRVAVRCSRPSRPTWSRRRCRETAPNSERERLKAWRRPRVRTTRVRRPPSSLC